MRSPINVLLATLVTAILVFYGCNTDQTTNVNIDGGDPGGTVITRVDTIYVDDCPPCIPDTIYSGNCPPCIPDTVYVDNGEECPDCPDCPACPDCPDCPPVNGSPYEGVFYITGMSAADVVESCSFSWIATTFQTVTIAEGMICFAGWMVDYDEATHTGLAEFTEHLEVDGIFQDTSVRFEITFSGYDNLTATLSYHVEAGYIGSGVSYFCDDAFSVTAERATVEEASRAGMFSRKDIPMPSVKADLLNK